LFGVRENRQEKEGSRIKAADPGRISGLNFEELAKLPLEAGCLISGACRTLFLAAILIKRGEGGERHGDPENSK
jgi:hypothetical protein